ncbi:helix-turn-helix domain-containing protein [Mycobacterium sp.]|uniref:helix-turn-helix domain-containing protein n=1 Tax=Mycobacterium sp. TaxID=1785 RepID=UPI003C73AE47
MDNDLLSRPHISRAEVMALLGIGQTTLWQLQKAGELRIGRRVFITTKSLQNYITKIQAD